jgi:GT2 family glycosyltransferase
VIPLLGVPVLNREDLAARMVGSVDVPVDELLVVVNAPVKGRVVEALEDAAAANLNVGRLSFSLPSFNLGCGGSWNHIIRHRPDGPWWLIVNADIVFAPGDLERLALSMADESAAVRTVFEFGAFALNRACVDAVGWFDENFHPMYYEDRDYEYRMRLAGVPYVKVESGAMHDTSSTIHSDRTLWERNRVTFQRNGEYYAAKWGSSPYCEQFKVPFNGAREPVLSRERLASQSW